MKPFKAFIATALMALFASQALAVTSSQWSLKNQDFAKGEMKNLSLSSKGQLRLERAFKKMEIENKDSLAIWSSAIDSKGAVYFGTGAGAAIYKLTTVDKVDKLEKIKLDEKVFGDDIIVTKMAVDSKDNVYAALMPSSRIIKITPDGAVSVYVNLSEFYIWDLCIDAKGNMYVGTGPAGRLYKVTDDGKKNSVIFDCDENHIFSLALADDGSLYFGTSQNAILFKISAEELAKEKPAPTVVYDFPGTDIRAIYARQGEVFLAVNNAAEKASRAYGEEMFREESGGSSEHSSEGPGARGSDMEREGTAAGKTRGVEYPVQGFQGGIVARIDKNGDIQLLLQTKNLVANIKGGDNTVYIATVGENRVYKYDITNKELSFMSIKEPQALAFELFKGELTAVGTSNPGVVYRVEDKVPQEGVYTSRVFDAASNSEWGNIVFRAAGKLSIQTRSGNTETPDNTWTQWSDASNENSFLVKSTHGRFLQFRATWQEQQAVIEEVTIYYSVVNLRPVVANIALGAGEGRGGGRDSTDRDEYPSPSQRNPIPQRPEPQKPTRVFGGPNQPLKVAWQAMDPNGDPLEYNVYYKEAREKRWKLLNRQGPTHETNLALQSALFPSGKYRIRVVASDKPGNPNGGALEAEMISDEFIIDNTAPTIANMAAATNKDAARNVMKTVVSGLATEETTHITTIEYALDGADWAYSLPKDGVFDNAAEDLAIMLDNLEPGEHTIVVRVSDENGNIGTAHLVFDVPQP